MTRINFAGYIWRMGAVTRENANGCVLVGNPSRHDQVIQLVSLVPNGKEIERIAVNLAERSSSLVVYPDAYASGRYVGPAQAGTLFARARERLTPAPAMTLNAGPHDERLLNFLTHMPDDSSFGLYGVVQNSNLRDEPLSYSDIAKRFLDKGFRHPVNPTVINFTSETDIAKAIARLHATGEFGARHDTDPLALAVAELSAELELPQRLLQGELLHGRKDVLEAAGRAMPAHGARCLAANGEFGTAIMHVGAPLATADRVFIHVPGDGWAPGSQLAGDPEVPWLDIGGAYRNRPSATDRPAPSAPAAELRREDFGNIAPPPAVLAVVGPTGPTTARWPQDELLGPADQPVEWAHAELAGLLGQRPRELGGANVTVLAAGGHDYPNARATAHALASLPLARIARLPATTLLVPDGLDLPIVNEGIPTGHAPRPATFADYSALPTPRRPDWGSFQPREEQGLRAFLRERLFPTRKSGRSGPRR